MTRTILLSFCLTVMTAAVYWPVHHFGLVEFDDITYLFDNPFIRSGLTTAGLRDAFFRSRFANYAPLVSISYYIDQDLFQLRPGPMHVENVLLHLVGGILLWRLLLVCTGKFYHSFAVAALFLCHPMHVESVAWISERKDVLSTPLLLCAMLAYVRYCQPRQLAYRRWTNYALMTVFFILSLLTKPMGVTLPAILLLMDFWPLGRWPGQTWFALSIEKLPLMILSIAATVIGGIAQRSGGAMSSIGEVDLLSRINNALVCYVIYIAKLIVPVNLAVFYPYPPWRPLAAPIAAGGLLLLATVIFHRLRKSKPYLLFGWLWFLGSLLPVIGLVQVGAQSMADRFSYLPSIGLFVAVVWWIGDCIKTAAPVAVALTIAVLIYCISARRQLMVWKDTQTLFTHALAVTDDNYLPHDQLGGVYLSRHEVARAMQEYQHALGNAQDPNALHGLGNCYLGIDYSQSVYYYQQAVSLLPKSVGYRTDLAVALRLDGKLQQAQRQAEIALKIDPAYTPARVELDKILNQLRPMP